MFTPSSPEFTNTYTHSYTIHVVTTSIFLVHPPGPNSVWTPSEVKLLHVRAQFVERVSEPVLLRLLDKLLEQGVITDAEMESAATLNRGDKARAVIDMVRKKGSRASSAMIAAVFKVDSLLSHELNLF